MASCTRKPSRRRARQRSQSRDEGDDMPLTGSGTIAFDPELKGDLQIAGEAADQFKIPQWHRRGTNGTPNPLFLPRQGRFGTKWNSFTPFLSETCYTQSLTLYSSMAYAIAIGWNTQADRPICSMPVECRFRLQRVLRTEFSPV